MNRAALAVILLAASSGVASAGGYLGLGVGTGPAASSSGGDLESDGRSGRLLFGFKTGKLAVEGAVSGWDMQFMTGRLQTPIGGTVDAWQASVAAKLSLPLSDGFEAFGRLGVHRTWLNRDDAYVEVAGNGYLLGAGIEYRFGIASVWMDYQYSAADVEGQLGEFDFSARMWTLGLSIGI
jgi:hypothetical protein